MRKELDIERDILWCGYLPDVEFARRPANKKGVGIAAITRPLYMQLLLPSAGSGSGGPYPIVVFVAGGGFHAPKVQYRLPALIRLAEKGFVVAMPEYRGTETAAFPDMVEDIKSAVRYLRIHGKEYHGDIDRIVLMGGSAGGNIVLAAAYTDGLFDSPQDDLTVSARVSGVIDLYGVTDVTKALPKELKEMNDFATSLVVRLTGELNRKDLEEKLKPMVVTNYLSKDADIPPTMIVHGDADMLVSIEQSELLYQALEAAGKDVEYYRVKGAGHADMKFFQPEMIKLYEAFIRRVTEHGQTEERKG